MKGLLYSGLLCSCRTSRRYDVRCLIISRHLVVFPHLGINIPWLMDCVEPGARIMLRRSLPTVRGISFF